MSIIDLNDNDNSDLILFHDGFTSASKEYSDADSDDIVESNNKTESKFSTFSLFTGSFFSGNDEFG